MTDVKSLETRIAPDRGYTGESPAEGGIAGFVCPRADAYGGREGIVPPGVAAVRGLVPKGMRRISPTDTAKAANAARDSGVSEAEQYREYYGRGAKEANASQASQASQAAKAAKAAKAARDAALAEKLAPAKGSAPSMPRRAGKSKFPAPAPVRPPDGAGRRPVSPADDARGRVLRDPDDAGMFSTSPERGLDDDTLDGFYEGLGRPAAGTADAGSASSADLGGTGAVPAVSAGGSGAAHSPAPRAQGGRIAELEAERDYFAEHVVKMSGEIGELRRRLEAYEAHDRSYMAEVERQLASVVEPETVRVALASDEERLKVGGPGWECNIVGSLHRGRGGRSFVLTVSDTAYASELLAEAQAGNVVVLSSAGRTSCVYAGRCAKIYGDAGSPDFITLMWLDAGPA